MFLVYVLKVLQHTRKERNLFNKPDRADQYYRHSLLKDPLKTNQTKDHSKSEESRLFCGKQLCPSLVGLFYGRVIAVGSWHNDKIFRRGKGSPICTVMPIFVIVMHALCNACWDLVL